MIDINKYNQITGESDIVKYIYPIPHIFTVTSNDYSAGFVTRYFVQKINDSNVIEVDQSNYLDVSKTLYKKVMLDWKLIGTERNVYKNGKLYEYGIYEVNLSALNNASKIISNLKSFVTDYTQYGRFIKS